MSEGWDYVVVGGGSAGAALAARLSEDPSASVLLLEAGPDHRTADTPLALTGAIDLRTIVQQHPEVWWTDLRARRSSAQEPREYGRGRCMGGSSAVNGMLALRGAPEDFDQWAASGIEGWSFADVLPAFIKLEDEHDFPDADHHGTGGPIPIFRYPEEAWGAIDVALRDAAVDAGYPWTPDYNAPAATGASPFAFTLRDRRRVSTNDGYLEPARERSNLRIQSDRLVDVVLHEQGTGRARGVRTAEGEQHLVSEGGEVILSAGAVHSPAILMRSGIGPADHLRKLGIPVVEDLPVGRRLQEHPLVTIPFAVEDASSLETASPMVCIRYTSGLAGGGSNDMMILTGGGYKAQKLTRGRGGSYAGLRLWVMESVSRGKLELASGDPRDQPVIDLGLLADERDTVRLEDGLQRVVDLLAQPAFERFSAGEPILPSRGDMLASVGDGFSGHVSSSCPIGAPGDPNAVLDATCRVLGTEGLRVVDASITPQIPRANTHISTVMFAEHAAGLIASPGEPAKRAAPPDRSPIALRDR